VVEEGLSLVFDSQGAILSPQRTCKATVRSRIRPLSAMWPLPSLGSFSYIPKKKTGLTIHAAFFILSAVQATSDVNSPNLVAYTWYAHPSTFPISTRVSSRIILEEEDDPVA